MARAFNTLLFLALPFAAACSGSVQINTPSTTGSLGKLTFQYEQDDCLLFCGESLSTPVLAGASVELEVTGGDPFTQFTAQVSPPDLADAQLQENCTCNMTSGNTASSRAVGITDACNSNETKSCIELVTVDTHGTGDVALQIMGPSGLVDETTLHLVAATSISAEVQVNGVTVQPGAGGRYAAKAGEGISITSTATDAQGRTLVYTRGAFLYSYLNPSVVASNPGLIGASNTETALAVSAGTAQLTEQAGVGVTTSYLFEVSP